MRCDTSQIPASSKIRYVLHGGVVYSYSFSCRQSYFNRRNLRQSRYFYFSGTVVENLNLLLLGGGVIFIRNTYPLTMVGYNLVYILTQNFWREFFHARVTLGRCEKGFRCSALTFRSKSSRIAHATLEKRYNTHKRSGAMHRTFFKLESMYFSLARPIS